MIDQIMIFNCTLVSRWPQHQDEVVAALMSVLALCDITKG